MIELTQLFKISAPDWLGTLQRKHAVMLRALLVSLLAVTHQSPATTFGATHQSSQTVLKAREEYQNLAIKRLRGEIPDTLKGIWLDIPIYRVEVTADEQGNVISVYPLYGDSLLAEAGQSAAREWKFPPQFVNGKLVRVVSAVDVQFQNLDAERKQGLAELAKKELQEHPDSSVSYFNAGYAYKANSQYKEATEYFQKAVEKAGDWAVGYFALGESYYGLDQFEKAIDSFRQAASRKQDYYEPYLHIGWCNLRLRRDADAVQAFLEAASRSKSADDKVTVYRNLVTSYESLGRKEEAADAQMPGRQKCREIFCGYQGVMHRCLQRGFFGGRQVRPGR
jgi:tetratricopeptide (TPR) repeat protein